MTMIRLLLHLYLVAVSWGMDQCPTKEVAPKGHWVTHDPATAPEVCKNLEPGDRADPSCCSGDVFQGVQFEEIIKDNDYEPCAKIFEEMEGGKDWYAQCLADGSVDYRERCDDKCQCAHVGTYFPGCWKQNDFKNTLTFISYEGCDCHAPSRPEGHWVVWKDESKLPDKCKGHEKGDEVDDECCAGDPPGTPYLEQQFSTISWKNEDLACKNVFAGVYGPGFANYATCDGNKFDYREDCDAECSLCESNHTYDKAGCSKQGDFPDPDTMGSQTPTFWPTFIINEGCEPKMANTNNGADSSIGEKCEAKVAPKGHWVGWFQDNTKNPGQKEIPEACKNIPLQTVAPPECCDEEIQPYENLTFETLVRDNNFGTCTVLEPFGNAPWYAECKADGDMGYGENCVEGCASCSKMATFQKGGCYAALAPPGMNFFIDVKGCECAVDDGATLLGVTLFPVMAMLTVLKHI